MAFSIERILTDIALAIRAMTPPLDNPYRISVYRSAALTIAVGYAKIVFDTVEYDPNSNFSSGTYTVPVTGVYSVKARYYISAFGGQVGLITLYKNGAEFRRGQQAFGASGDSKSFEISVDIPCVVGDTLDIYSYLGTASRTCGVGSIYTYFTVHLVCK